MAFGYTRTLPEITGSHPDFPVLLTAGSFPPEAIDGGSTSILDGGGNLRAYTDNTKTTQLPVQIVSFITGVAPEIQVWIKIPTAATNNTIYIEADDVEIAQPPVTDPFGRNAVWSNYLCVYHFEQIGLQTDSTGNGFDLTQFGSATVEPSKIGNGVRFNGTDTRFTRVGNVRSDNSFTLSSWFSTNSTATVKGFFDDGLGTIGGLQVPVGTNNKLTIRLDESGPNVAVINSDGIIADGIQKLTNIVVDKTSNLDLYINQTKQVETANISGFGDISPTANFFIGNRDVVDWPFNGVISFFSITETVKNTDLILTEYQNQDDPDNWGTSSAWEEQELQNYELIIDSGAYTYTGTEILFNLGSFLEAQPGAYAYTGTDLNFVAGQTLIAEPGAYSYTGTDVDLISTRFILAKDGVYTYTGTPIFFDTENELITESGQYTYTGTDIEFFLGQEISIEPGAYTYAGQNIPLIAESTIITDSGEYTYTGTRINLIWSGLEPIQPVAIKAGYKPTDFKIGYI